MNDSFHLGSSDLTAESLAELLALVDNLEASAISYGCALGRTEPKALDALNSDRQKLTAAIGQMHRGYGNCDHWCPACYEAISKPEHRVVSEPETPLEREARLKSAIAEVFGWAARVAKVGK